MFWQIYTKKSIISFLCIVKFLRHTFRKFKSEHNFWILCFSFLNKSDRYYVFGIWCVKVEYSVLSTVNFTTYNNRRITQNTSYVMNKLNDYKFWNFFYSYSFELKNSSKYAVTLDYLLKSCFIKSIKTKFTKKSLFYT